MKKCYNVPKWNKSQIKTDFKYQGETIEQKVERILTNKEAIKDGAPEIFTERKDGVLAAYNIRSDRFEIAAEAMDKAHRSDIAKREARADMKVVKDDNPKMGKDDKVEPTHGTGGE